MKLSEAHKYLVNNINKEEILFISDIENFDKEVSNYLNNRIKEEKIKLVVFIGDILSFLSKDSNYHKMFELSEDLFKMFYDYKKTLKNCQKIRKGIDLSEASKFIIGSAISDYILKKHKEQINQFKSFVRNCKKNKISIIYYSGNHDSMMSWVFYTYNTRRYGYIPVLKSITEFENLYIPEDLELIKINDDLYLTGIHTEEDTMEKYKFPLLTGFENSLKTIEKPEKIIFVSHIPGVERFRNLGSEDITNFKKRFKFMYHYHGHCRNYDGEYLEAGVPTKSVHINFENILQKSI